MEPQYIHNHREAFSKGDHKSRNVLPKLFDCFVNKQLTHCIQYRQFQDIHEELLVV